MSTEITARAEAIVNGAAPVPSLPEIVAMQGELQCEQQFGLARQLLARASSNASASERAALPDAALAARSVAEPPGPSLLWLVQQQALCTYKDVDLPPNLRNAMALDLLGQIGLTDPNLSNGTTLAIGAAVYKRSWEQQGLIDDLHQSLALYKAGWERNPQDPDSCYCADQAAFIYDQIASRLATGQQYNHLQPDPPSSNAPHQNERALRYRDNANQLRLAALAEMQQRQQNWPERCAQNLYFLITLANLQLGLGLKDTARLPEATRAYRQVVEFMQQAARHSPGATQQHAAEWTLQEVFKQAMALTRLHHFLPPECARPGDRENHWPLVEPVFNALLGKDAYAAHTYHRGKVGLGLSGGGFRAAFYHLGVMARLAEIDALRSIEVISTVSGGSVLGAFYYLEVANLLRQKPDQQLSTADYIQVIQRVQQQFLAGVQKNIGVLVHTNLAANLRMIGGNYSNSYRIGEIYEQELYNRVADGHAPEQPRSMPELMIHPHGQPDFNPRYDNWRRTAKVPILLLNTTSFNTGHNWHFTASWMGEPPGLLKDDVDPTERYRRLYYHQAPSPELQQFRLGYAVAASSCVPGIFEAVAINNLYPERIVNLFDGGVHDNQGITGLLDEGCTRILCSDASGQMSEDAMPTSSFLGVPMRANAILQNRVRGAQYQDVRVRADSQVLQGLFFVHMRQCLPAGSVDWIGSPPGTQNRNDGCDKLTGSASANDLPANTTPYGIDRALQRRIAAIRTDLDSFTEVEANALMLSGYLTAEYEFKVLQQRHQQQGLPGTWGGYQIDAPRGSWPFLQLEPIMRRPADPEDEQRTELEKQLTVSSEVYFKIWFLNPALKRSAKLLGALLLIFLAWFLWYHWDTPIAAWLGRLTWGMAILLVAVPTALMAFHPIKMLLTPKASNPGIIYKTLMAVVSWAAANVHMAVFEKMYLKQGTLARLLKMKGK
jgi:predicted acylesterase/phospholipase RssA